MFSWRSSGQCVGSGINFFAAVPSKEAVQACSVCIVKKECGDYAILNESFGYWANMTARERVKIRMMRGIPEPSEGILRKAPPSTRYIESQEGIHHGEVRGYQLHLKRRQTPCSECLEANRKSMAEYRKRKQEEWLQRVV